MQTEAIRHQTFFDRLGLVGRLLACLSLVQGAFLQAQEEAGRTIIVIVADDLGVDQVGAYRAHAGVPSVVVPSTPNLDALAAEGALFRYAYANPQCSPTRAVVLTGRFSCRQGVGGVTGQGFGEPFTDDEVTLPELLRAANTGFTSAAIGKWHLGYDWDAENQHLGRNHMVNSGGGFDYFCGTENNFTGAEDSHSHFVRRTLRRNPDDLDRPIEIEPDALQSRFSATVQIDDVLTILDARHTPVSQDLFVYLALNVPHEPFEKPPDELHSLDEQLGEVWQKLPPRWDGKRVADAHLYYTAMVEAMDQELGRLRRELPTARQPRTTFLFFGDNGTPQQTTVAPFVPTHAKGTLYEGGIRVPMIVAGAGVEVAPGTVIDQMVQAVDVFATVADLAGLPAERVSQLVALPLDSHSLRPLLDSDPDNDLQWPRWWAFAERFGPNGGEGDPMDTIDALDPPLIAPNLPGHERPTLGAATLHVEGEPFVTGNRSQVVLRNGADRRCQLRITASLLPLTQDRIAKSVVGPLGELDALVLAGPGVRLEEPVEGIYNMMSLDLDRASGAAERTLFALTGELSDRLAGTGCTVLFQALLLDDGSPPQVVGVTNIVMVEAPRNQDIKAIRDDRYKLILTDNGGKEQLFDLAEDPWEARNLLMHGVATLAPDRLKRYARLKQEMNAIITGKR